MNDVSVKHSDNPGYRVTSVAGAPPKRKSGIIVTYVPVILLTPGQHSLDIQSRSEPKTKFTMTENFKSGVSYELHFRDGQPSIVPK